MARTPFFGSGSNVHAFPRPWHKLCQASRNNLINNARNAVVALSNDPEFTGRLRYDEMLASTVLDGQAITNAEIESVHIWLQENGLKRLGLDVAREAIDVVGRKYPFNPLRDWLDGLAWDGSLRLSQWLISCLGVADSEYHRQIGSCFLKGMVARIYQPGCKCDYMLVLEGPQGVLKSSICATIAGSQYFSDTLPDLGSDHVRVSTHLRGKWLVEVSELSSFSRADASKLKQFISTPEEKYMPKYGRKEVTEPRTCLFIGTTNDDHYLRDPTGGRRFWPVKCGAINLDWLVANRDQLFAEAVSEYQRTQRWWPEADFERQHIAPIQEQRLEVDAWDEPVLGYLLGRDRLTMVQLADEALGLKKDRFGVADQRRIANILRAAGWRQHKGSGGARHWIAP